MNLLFISPQFFDYEKFIKAELEQRGWNVDWHDDRPSSSSLIKALIRYFPKLVSTVSNNYFDAIIEASRNKKYDVVFIIKGEALSSERLRRLRHYHYKALFLYYSWDSLNNFKENQERFDYFDMVYSFDRLDSIDNPKVKHLPLFYIPAFEQLAKSNLKDSLQDIDLLFLGSIHSDRYAVVTNILKAAKHSISSMRSYSYFFYQSKWVFALRKFTDPHFMKIPWGSIQWQSLKLEKTLNLMSRSRIIVDVNHPRQSGLTLRTIEGLGSQKKLITTNKDVINYDFYRPQNICVVERECPIVPSAFLLSPHQSLPDEIYAKYSLRSWIKEIFDNNLSSRANSCLPSKNYAPTKSAKKVLVTGANGFIGKALCDALIRDGHDVVATVRQSDVDLKNNSDINYLSVGEIDEHTDWSTALKDVEVVIHAAARVHVMKESTLSPLKEFRKTNTEATEHLARVAACNGVKRFIFISSVNVNGEETEGSKKFTEKDERDPKSPFGISKSEAELKLELVAKETGLEVTIIRPPLVYGPRVRANFLKLLSLIYYGTPLPFKSIKNKRSLIFVDNLVDAILTCAAHPEAKNKIYMVSDGEDVSIYQLIWYISDAFYRKCRAFSFPTRLINILAKLIGIGDIDRLTLSLAIDNSKIKHELGWQPPYTLAQGLKITVDWYLSQRLSSRSSKH